MPKEFASAIDLELSTDEFGIDFKKRGIDDPHVLINLWSGDDETYHCVDSFSSYWLDDLIKLLLRTKKMLNNQKHRFKKDKDGFGHEFKY